MLKTILKKLGYFDKCQLTLAKANGVMVEAYKVKKLDTSFTIFLEDTKIGILDNKRWFKEDPAMYELSDPNIIQILRDFFNN